MCLESRAHFWEEMEIWILYEQFAGMSFRMQGDKTMLKAIIRSRKLRAFGSVIDVSPLGDYSELMPVGSACDRIGKYWEAVDQHVGNAIERDDKQPSRRNRRDLTTA